LVLFHVAWLVYADAPPKKAGEWMFTTATVAGAAQPVVVAALPAAAPIPVVDGKRRPAYLSVYCHGAPQLRGFVDLREGRNLEGARAWVNGREVTAAGWRRLVEGNNALWVLPEEVVRALRHAQSLEVAAGTGGSWKWVMLHWPEVRERVLAACDRM
jgi:hypothetical protein